ncbi:MAG: DUF3617 family protein [Nitrosomonadales bacterium]|nr:DUF3617 family protein [Nitrosomonadales bacterium]
MRNIFLGMLWLGAMGSALAAGSDELWEVSSKMEMKGMPFAMPAQSNNVCIPKGQEKDPNRSVPNDKNCKMSDVKVSGNKMTWKMQCEGKDAMSGSGEMTYGPGTYSGKMNMHSKEGDMVMAYDGKRIGSCDAAAEKKRMENLALAPMKEANDKQRAECKKMLDEGGKSLVNGYNQFVYQGSACSDMKPAMCDKVRMQAADYRGYGDLAAEEKNAAEMRKQMGKQAPRSLAAECGMDMARLERNLCQKAKGDNKYGFIAANCPAEAQALAKQHCDAWGRDYTSDHDNEYAPVCAKYSKNKSSYNVADEETDGKADSAGDKGGLMGKLFGGKSNDGAAAKDDKSASGDNPAGAVLDGAKKLKGMFGF